MNKGQSPRLHKTKTKKDQRLNQCQGRKRNQEEKESRMAPMNDSRSAHTGGAWARIIFVRQIFSRDLRLFKAI